MGCNGYLHWKDAPVEVPLNLGIAGAAGASLRRRRRNGPWRDVFVGAGHSAIRHTLRAIHARSASASRCTSAWSTGATTGHFDITLPIQLAIIRHIGVHAGEALRHFAAIERGDQLRSNDN